MILGILLMAAAPFGLLLGLVGLSGGPVALLAALGLGASVLTLAIMLAERHYAPARHRSGRVWRPLRRPVAAAQHARTR